MSTGKDWQRHEDWHAKQMQLEAVIADLRQNLQDAHKRIYQMEGEAIRATEVLRHAEWGDHSHPDRFRCPVCRQDDVEGHASYCALDRVLKSKEATP